MLGLLCAAAPAPLLPAEGATTPAVSRAEALEPHARNGSGTSWQPEAAPMAAAHLNAPGGWSVMLHGALFALYDRQGGPRGDSRFVAPNWFMAMGGRAAGPGRLALRAMLSLDPLFVRPRGYPLLFQTGETFEGRPLVDAQHPHDLFMEMAAIWTRPFSGRTALQIYAAPVGEPALGPVAFMHRASAAENPLAVLGHHYQDSTHIAFGVATLGVIHRRVKVEGSLFNGHEPDEERWGFDPIRLNSYSGRISWAPGPRWALQASRGRLDSPEELAPGEDLTRTTASALYAAPLGRGTLAAGLVWGRNNEKGDREDAYGLEATWTPDGRTHLHGRLERVDRTGLVDTSDPESGPEVVIHALTLGATRSLIVRRGLDLGAGAIGTVYRKDEVLDPIYGDNPGSLYLFLRLRPALAESSGHGSMHNH